METSATRQRQLAIGGGLTPSFAANLREACGPFCSHELLPDAATPDGLLDTLASLDDSRPVTMVLSGRWLKEEGLELLLEARHRAPGAITLAVGAGLGSLALGHALRYGVRGLVDPALGGDELVRALEALASGDVWISRRQLVAAVEHIAPEEKRAPADVWLNLPALTEREKAVLLEVLEGMSNKLIARKLDISEQTVKIHVMHVYRKLGVNRRVDLLKALSLNRTAAPSPIPLAV